MFLHDPLLLGISLLFSTYIFFLPLQRIFKLEIVHYKNLICEESAGIVEECQVLVFIGKGTFIFQDIMSKIRILYISK